MMEVQTVSRTLETCKTDHQIRLHFGQSDVTCRHDFNFLNSHVMLRQHEGVQASRCGLWRRHPTAVSICCSSGLLHTVLEHSAGADLCFRRKSNIYHHCLFCDRNVNVFMGTWWCRGPSSSWGEGDKCGKAMLNVALLMQITEQCLEMQIWSNKRERNNWRM
jgi:hypothetical protein